MTTQTSVKPLDTVELAAWRGFLVAHARLVRALDAELTEAHGLPLSSYEVLLILAHAPDGRLRMSELGEQLLLTPSGISRLVDRLERAGLVRREPCEDDRRGLFACITPEGRARWSAARGTHMRGIRERFLDRLTRDEQVLLGEAWRRVDGDDAQSSGNTSG